MVFTVFRLLTDFVCLYNYEFWLSLCKIVRSLVILLLPLFTILFCIFQIHFQKIAIFGKQVTIPIYNIVLSGIMAWYKIWILYELLPGIFYGQHRKSGWYSVKSSHFHFLYTGMIFFSYLTDFIYCFLKVTGHGQNWSKRTILKGGVDGFCYFSLIFSDFIF